MQLEKYSFGTGDRFGKEGAAQLRAIQEINRLGVPVVPVWNKSNREHVIIGSVPAQVRTEAEAAVKSCQYTGSYYVDADHINLDTVDRFLESSNFFTIDVARFIGVKPAPDEAKDFIAGFGQYRGDMTIPGIEKRFRVTGNFLASLADNYLVAMNEVAGIYNHISRFKGQAKFIAEVSVDEAELVQGPLDLFFILAMLKKKGVEVQTIAPKFSGLFAKGIDYIGSTGDFTVEFEQDVAVIQHAVRELGLPVNLKLSVHSGSDKYSIYPAIRSAMRKFNAGIHIKTAGTTWLEEVIGLAEAGAAGLEMVKEIYCTSLKRYAELTGPYATVLALNQNRLPLASEVNKWNSRQFSAALTHDQKNKNYNPHFRQLIHVGYKIAAEMGRHFTEELDKNRSVIENNVTINLLERHLKPVFL
jgi:hypothetical protein